MEDIFIDKEIEELLMLQPINDFPKDDLFIGRELCERVMLSASFASSSYIPRKKNA